MVRETFIFNQEKVKRYYILYFGGYDLMLGECIVKNVKCKYHFDGKKIFLIPIEPENSGVLYRSLLSTIMKEKKYSISTQKDRSNGVEHYVISSIYLCFGGSGVSCKVKEYYEFYSENEFDEVTFTSPNLTAFIELASHFYEKKKNNIPFDVDMLYDSEIINKFSFMFEEQVIDAVLKTGGILKRGTASDLKFKISMSLVFKKTQDIDFLSRLLEKVKKVISFLCYWKDIELNNIVLSINDNDQKSNICNVLLCNQEYKYQKNCYSLDKSVYNSIKDQLGIFFTEVIKDQTLYSKHLPKLDDKHFGYDVIRFLNIFSAFENEYKKLPKSKRKRDSSHLTEIRRKVIGAVSTVEGTDEEESKFISSSIERIQQVGTSYNERKKIEIAYNLNSNYIEHPLRIYNIDKKNIGELAQKICNMRDLIVHNNYDEDIDDIDMQKNIAFLEWLTYSMFLSRIKILNIKEIIGVKFGFLNI